MYDLKLILKNRYEVDFLRNLVHIFRMWKIAKSLICEPIYLNNFEVLILIYYVCQRNLDSTYQ